MSNPKRQGDRSITVGLSNPAGRRRKRPEGSKAGSRGRKPSVRRRPSTEAPKGRQNVSCVFRGMFGAVLLQERGQFLFESHAPVVVFRSIDSNGLSATLTHDPAEIRMNPLTSRIKKPELPTPGREDNVMRQVHTGYPGTLSAAPSGLFSSLATFRRLAPPATCFRPSGSTLRLLAFDASGLPPGLPSFSPSALRLEYGTAQGGWRVRRGMPGRLAGGQGAQPPAGRAIVRPTVHGSALG